MFSYVELTEIENLCTENAAFKKYFNIFKDENTHLLSNIVHEIGNPLTIIYSTIQLMESKNPSIKSQPYWDQLTEDVRNLSQLLQDYSDYNNCSHLKFKEENLFDILYMIRKSFEPVLTSKNISFHMDIAKNMIPVISSYNCDGIKLRQVFINIIKNGMEAIGENGDIRLTVPPMGEKIQDFTQGTDNLIIIIGNNGAPISKSELENLFTPFISSKLGGSGVGLSISSKIVEAHGGIIFADSAEEQTEFTICLPL